MEPEIKQLFETLLSRIDDLKKSIEKIEDAHNKDHDNLIRMEGRIEGVVGSIKDHCEIEKTYGRQVDSRFRAVDKKLWMYGLIIALISGGMGGSVGEIVKKLLSGF